MWQCGHRAFREAQSDTFVLASPDGNMVWTCDDGIIQQLYNMHPSVEVPVEYMGFFSLYGPTVFTVQGEQWKIHRRAITAGLGSTIDKDVWEESRNQTESLIKHWREEQDSVTPVIRRDTSALALFVIASRFFGIPMSWNKDRADQRMPEGHNLPFDKALFNTIGHLGLLFMMPVSVLKYFPGSSSREAYLGFTELTKYMKGLQQSASTSAESLTHRKNKTLLGRCQSTWCQLFGALIANRRSESLVLSSFDPEITGKEQISNESVTGNIFFTMLAGHETTGGTLAFIFLLLTIHPQYQRRIQAELDQHFGSRPKSEWSYERDFKTLQRGFIGAVQKETLYLYEPAGFVMRKAVEPVLLIDSDNQKHSVPKDTLFLINNAASSHHPSRQTLRPEVTREQFLASSKSPALYFNPERWLGLDDKPEMGQSAAHLPYFHVFGGGARICPGRGFAQTEMTSVMATLLKDYSLEFEVSDKMLQRYNGDRMCAYRSLREQAIKMLYTEVKANITIALETELPLRVVKRSVD